MVSTSASIEQRLSQLENQNRWLKRLVMIPTLLLTLICCMGAVNQFQNGIEVMSGGKQRGWFGVSDGGIGLQMYGQNNKYCAFVGQSTEWAPSFQLYNGRGDLTAEMIVEYKTGFPSVSFYDPSGTNRLDLSITEGKPSLAFYDKQGTNRMLLSSLGLSFYNAQGDKLPSSINAY